MAYDHRHSSFKRYLFVPTVPIWKVARYTCTSPLSVTEADGYVDASPISINLCELALTRIEEFSEQRGGASPAGVGCVVSVGQGSFAGEPLGYVEARGLLCAGGQWGDHAAGVGMLRNLVYLYNSGAVSADTCKYTPSKGKMLLVN